MYDTIFAVIPNYVSVTDTLIIDVSLTNIENEGNSYNNQIKVYPNPTHDIIYINNGENFSKMKDFKINIIDNIGRLVYESKINDQLFSVDLSAFGAKGLYFITLINGGNKVIDVRKILLH